MRGFLFASLTCLLVVATVSANDWVDRVSVKGDFRYRHEWIDTEGAETDRHRQRIRFRLAPSFEVNEEVDIKARLATGGSDPVSTNQTLDDGFSTKDIMLDRAYFDYHPASVERLHLLGGKMGVPFYKPQKSGLIWDGDLSPEGIALSYAAEIEFGELFVNAATFWAEENIDGGADAMLNGLQLGLKTDIEATDGALGFGAGYFDFTNVEANTLLVDAGDSFGNTVDGEGNYAEDFTEVEVFMEYGQEVHDLPIAVFGDCVTNTSADQDNIGWLAGFKIGKAREPRSLDFTYFYEELQADAVIGAYSDSDFGGGGTDAKGHVVKLGYQISDGWSAGVTYFSNDRVLEDATWYRRLQADLNFAF